MIKEIKVFPRVSMDAYIANNRLGFPYGRWYFISIYGDDSRLVNPKTSKILNGLGCVKSASLLFWDITDKSYNEIKKSNSITRAILFNDKHAKQIIWLIDLAQKDPTDSALVVHCAAGISRSGAVATFACDYCRLDYANFLKDNPCLYPNQFVLRTLHRIAGMTPIGSHDGIDHRYDHVSSYF
jgi:hypothetical protein